ncbi:enoyl-CoA hydratase-related protein [Sphingomonas sp. RP10(2022)]|uniref:Enoyl-CoA hydratase-related protein n=1 Tax=Sphingomonas liriopis TaxID=2949094 RepID=A0A9X2KSX5_9SPHN|nr:enoyl-CoA hydratase-related protein [Sphingomonas liriopis]MCP3734293.1 enoyl-CoA hydratase-related protein [Sphingomonas liriopis]
MADYTDIRLAVRDGVAELTLDRPAALNALTLDMAAELEDAVARVSTDLAVRAVLLTGAGRAFCSGADLRGDAGGGATDVGESLERFFNPLLETLFAMPKPLVVAVNGPAAGAGFSLALAGDVILAGRSACFIQAFTKVGLVPDLGSTWLLPRQIGRGRAMALMMLGDRLSAERALDWGMIYGVEEDDALPAAARALAARLAAGPTRAYAMLRRAVRDGLEGGLADALARERADQREAGFTQDFAEGARAFLDRRAPVFTGA